MTGKVIKAGMLRISFEEQAEEAELFPEAMRSN